jgi:hypothetical protein
MKDEDNPTIEFPATVLDRDNQLLASGQARLYTKRNCGMFWTQVPKDVHSLPNCATTLRSSTGSLYEIRNLKVYPHHYREIVNHCEFEYVPVE